MTRTSDYATNPQPRFRRAVAPQDSSKGGSVETGCSGLYDVIR